jgi:copper chaperone CopZ
MRLTLACASGFKVDESMSGGSGMTMERIITFEVVGDRKMSCASCETLIVLMLKRVSGVGEVAAHAATKQVTVSFNDAELSDDKLRQALAKIGFAVDPVAVVAP